MPYCSSCGNEMTGAFCGKCGAPSSGGAPRYSATQSAGPAAGGLTDNLAGALCYLFGLVTGVIFLVVAPFSTKPGIRFHAFQSILFNIAWFAVWILFGIVVAMLPSGLSLAMAGLSGLLSLAFIGIWLFLMFRTYQDQPFVLPVIGPIAQQLANKQ
jgi:uncharacterized membrane protein